MTTPAASTETPAADDAAPHGYESMDAWGNRITLPRGWFGQYTIASWRADRRTVYVCGQPEQHVRQGMWRRDGRMEGNGQGYICSTCWTLECGLYGVKGRA